MGPSVGGCPLWGSCAIHNYYSRTLVTQLLSTAIRVKTACQSSMLELEQYSYNHV